VIERYRHLSIPKFFRGDAAFAIPALYRVLEKEGYHYVIRLKANAVLEREIEQLLTRTASSLQDPFIDIKAIWRIAVSRVGQELRRRLATCV